MTEPLRLMSLKDFLKRLSKTPRKWKLRDGRFIRQPRPYHDLCPITGVLNNDSPEKLEVSELYAGIVGREHLKLAPTVIEQIILAADGDKDMKPRIRKQLLKACGLKEKA